MNRKYTTVHACYSRDRLESETVEPVEREARLQRILTALSRDRLAYEKFKKREARQ